MGDTTYHAMAFAEGDIDNHGRFEPLAADMKPYSSGADIDAACAPVLPPDAYYTGRPGHTPMPSRCGTRPARSATAWPASGVDATGSNWSAQFGGLGYDGDLDLYTVNGMVGEAFGYLPGAELLSTGWPVPRRASPLPMLSRSGSRSWKSLRRRSPGAAARPQCQAPSRAGALFAAAAATLKTIAADPKHLGAEIGCIAVLHTWGQALVHHPHLHCVIPGGGLISPDATDWISCPNGFFLPVRVLARLFRGKLLKLLAALTKRFAADRLQFHGALSELAHPARFRALCDQLHNKEWVVYCKPPFGGPEQVLKYLARYTHRVAIANSRITAADSDSVSFRYKDYKRGGHRHRVMKLDAVEFLRRFLQHVLPARFVRIRHYGFLANRARKQKLPLCRRLIAQATGHNISTSSDLKASLEAPGDDGERCPACHAGTMRRIQDFRAQPTWEYQPPPRGPPDTA